MNNTPSQFKLSIFGDEIAVDFETQLQELNKLGLHYLDLRKAWDTRVDQLTDQQIERIAALCEQYNIEIACIGSPIGKSPIQDSLQAEIDRLKRIAIIAHSLNTKRVRIFSFYPDGDVTEQAIEASIARLQQLAELAAELDVDLLLENEKGLVGDTPSRVLYLLKAVNHDRFRFIWDPANFVQCGAENQVDEWWDTLGPYIAYIHIKDARLSDGVVKPAGEGDGQVDKLVQKLADSGYDGFLSLEPHLKEAMHSSGFSGPRLSEVAVNALHKIIDDVGAQAK